MTLVIVGWCYLACQLRHQRDIPEQGLLPNIVNIQTEIGIISQTIQYRLFDTNLASLDRFLLKMTISPGGGVVDMVSLTKMTTTINISFHCGDVVYFIILCHNSRIIKTFNGWENTFHILQRTANQLNKLYSRPVVEFIQLVCSSLYIDI